MILLSLLPPALLVLTGLCSFFLSSRPRLSHALGAAGAAAASLLGLVITALALLGGRWETLSAAWNTTVGASFSIGFDALSGFFLLPIYGLSAVCAVYGFGYLRHSPRERSLGSSWLFFSILAASMALVVLARNAVLFLFAWEIMSLSSWVLVTHEHEKEETRQAGITYLVATQIGTAFLIVMFLILGTAGNTGAPAATPGRRRRGSGAGFLTVHLRVGGGHPPRGGRGFPSQPHWFRHEGGDRSTPRLAPRGASRGPVPRQRAHERRDDQDGNLRNPSGADFPGRAAGVVGMDARRAGAVSGIAGVLFALAQHDIKKLLAYHSVENIGIICLGLGVGFLGVSYNAPVVAVLGFAGGLLHVLNHAIFKGLLFLGAGAAAHATGTRDMDRLGGLLKRMPADRASASWLPRRPSAAFRL